MPQDQTKGWVEQDQGLDGLWLTSEMLSLVLDVVAGMLLLAAIAAAAATKDRRRSSTVRRAAGWILVALPLPLAVALQLTGQLSAADAQPAFLAGLAAFAVGAFLILATADDDDEDWSEADDRSPPWWPDFERAFRDYTVRSSPRPERIGRR